MKKGVLYRCDYCTKHGGHVQRSGFCIVQMRKERSADLSLNCTISILKDTADGSSKGRCTAKVEYLTEVNPADYMDLLL